MSGGYSDNREQELVKSIFEKSGIDCITGFNTKGIGYETEVDVLGVYRNVIIFVECVGNDNLGPKTKKAATDFKNLTGKYFNKLKEKLYIEQTEFYQRNRDGFETSNFFIAKLLVSFNELTKEDIRRHIKRLCETEKIALWSEEEYYYYSTIADASYDHCRYEIFNSLGISPEKVDEGEDPGPLVFLAYGRESSGVCVLNLIVPVKILLSRSTVKRLCDASSEEGYQRLLNKKKLERMRQYLLEGEFSYPNNIVCVLSDQVVVKKNPIANFSLKKEEVAKTKDMKQYIEKELFLVELPKTYDAFEMVDGQHRLFSFAQSKYSLFEKKLNRIERLAEEDKRIKELAERSSLTVTAIKGNVSSAKLFFDINTTQTGISPEDVIDLKEKFYPESPTAAANRLLKKLNNEGILENKIRVKFWQKDKIKRTSLISYGGVERIFDRKKVSYRIFEKAYKAQGEIKNYEMFCLIIINNFLIAFSDIVGEKIRSTEFRKMSNDLVLKNYYLFSAVFVGALVRLLHHFISDQDKEFGVVKNLDKVLKSEGEANDLGNSNLKKLFRKGLEIIVKDFSFSKEEFEGMAWKSNSWTPIEATLFYKIRERYPNFGNENLIYKNYRRDLSRN